MVHAWELIKQTIKEWQEDEAPRMGASLAYYALFSLAPLLVIVIAIVGFVYKGLVKFKDKCNRLSAQTQRRRLRWRYTMSAHSDTEPSLLS